MKGKFYDPTKCMGFMTFTANRLLMASLQKHMAEVKVDLTPEQWGVLTQFWNRGAVTQEEITQTACVDKSSMSRVLERMERRGLIARRLDPADRRRKILNLTDEADTLKEDSLKAVQATLAQALRGVEPDECAVCLKVLSLVKKNLRDAAK